jgi:hypothetical protein
MRDTTHTDKLGRVAEDLATIKLSTLFKDCVVSHVINNQPHDVEIRRIDETLTKGICKIQVKSTTTRQSKRDSYHINIWYAKGAALGQKVGYNLDDLDFFLLYVFPEAKFYVVPSSALGTKTGIQLFVGCDTPRHRTTERPYEKYLEAWWLIGDFLGVPTSDDKRETQTLLLSGDD